MDPEVINLGEDAYPAVLERIGELLTVGYNSGNIGTAEADILAEIAGATYDVLAEFDPPSRKFIPQLGDGW